MFKTLANAWKIKDIRTKILFTLLLILIYRLGSFIPVPGVDATYIAEQADKFDILTFLNLFSGGAFSKFTIFAMGISPYITGSIIINLLTIAIPALERLSKEEDGRQKIEKITRFTGIGFALVQSVGITLSLGADAVINTSFFTYLTIGLVCTAGTAFLMWMGERITERGIGNGVSMLIFASIVSSVPNVIIDYINRTFVTATLQIWVAPFLLLLVLIIIAGVVFVDRAERRVPIQYAKKVVGRKLYGGQSTHIPMKANANGVMPLIFAMTLMSFPSMVFQIVAPDSKFFAEANKIMGQGTVAYYVIYGLLILGFAYFYTTISFNPIEMSKNLQQNGGFIPGIRPGKPTSDYMKRISSRLTFFGAIFLMLIAMIPTILMGSLGEQSMFGPTSVLIMVSVALETTQQLESMMLMRHYKGFLG